MRSVTQVDAQHESQQPLCPEGDARFWAGVGLAAVVVVGAGQLLGWPRLPGARSVEETVALQRISALLAGMIWTALCTGAGGLAVVAVAMVRMRPAGGVLDILSRAFACVAMARLVQLLPMGTPLVQQVVDVGAFLVCVTLLGRAAFRMPLLDAVAAVALAVGAVAGLTTAAYAVVWAVLS